MESMQEALETEKRELNVLKEKQEEIKIQTYGKHFRGHIFTSKA